MENLSKIEIIGTAGAVKEQIVNDFRVVRMSVAVNIGYGHGCVHTDWFNVVYWPEKSDTRKWSMGDTIHAEGRMTGNRYTRLDGVEVTYWEIRANKIW